MRLCEGYPSCNSVAVSVGHCVASHIGSDVESEECQGARNYYIA